MPPESTPADLTIACHVRPALVLEPVDAKIETLRRCERDGTIDSLLLRSWPGEVAVIEDSPHPEVLDAYDRFSNWAERADVTVHPPFQTRETTSIASDRTIDRLVTPTICLACYEDGRLASVFPHTDGETTHTVPEVIAALRTGELPDALREGIGAGERTVPSGVGAPDGGESPPDGRQPSQSSDWNPTCPDCGGGLTNVQGVLDCVGCDWVSADGATSLAPRH